MVTTVGDFVAGDLLEVIGGQAVPLEGRTVDQVKPFGAGWQPLHPPAGRRRFLAIVPAEEPPADIGAALRALARQGAVAVSLSGDVSELNLDAVLRAADACDLIALAAPGTLSASQFIGALMHRQTEAYRRRHEITREMFRLAAQLHRRGQGPGRLVDYIARQTGARMDIISRGDALWEELAVREPYLDQLAGGVIAVKADHTATAPTPTDAATAPAESGWHLSLHALHGRRPHPVLYARAPGVLSADTLDLIEHTAAVASMLPEPQHRQKLAEAAADNRAAILQYLQMGEVTTAARIAERLAPGVLTAQAGRVAIIECDAGEDRAEVSEACEAALSPVLVGPCPAYDTHLILTLPDENDDAATQKALGPLAEGRAVGVSSARPWIRTGLSYQNAFHALTTARARGTRIALESGEAVATLLPIQARAWGRAMAAPLKELAAEHRGLYVHTAQVALAHGDARAGKLLGVPRTTAGTRLADVMGAMGLTRGSLTHRATADLALQLADLPLTEDEVERRPEDLTSLLTNSAEAHAWAAQYLAPLDEHQVKVLTAWLTADGHITAAAQALGTGRSSVTRWLDQAGARLSRALRDPGEGPHDPLWALLISRQLPADVLPNAAFRAHP